jgi:hypothetical protein
MDKQQARKIIKDAFESRFDQERYIHFLRELLNSFDDEGHGSTKVRGSLKSFRVMLRRSSALVNTRRKRSRLCSLSCI